jgi:hypothetical protein
MADTHPSVILEHTLTPPQLLYSHMDASYIPTEWLLLPLSSTPPPKKKREDIRILKGLGHQLNIFQAIKVNHDFLYMVFDF